MCKNACYYLITVQLDIQVSLVCVQTDVAFFLHVLVTHSVICNGIYNIKIQHFYFMSLSLMLLLRSLTSRNPQTL